MLLRGRTIRFAVLVLAGITGAWAQNSQPASELPAAPSAVQSGQAASAPSPPSAGAATPADLVSQERWPREVKSGQNIFTVYQPQLDSWDGFHLEAKAAVSVKTSGNAHPSYGVLWFSASTEVDKNNRLVTLSDITIARVRFPAAPDKEAAYLATIQKSVVTKTKLLSLDRLEALLAVMEAEKSAAIVPVKNEPPAIFFSEVPAMLVYVDGAPVYQRLKDLTVQRVVNTRALILRDVSGKHYLHLMDGWMESPQINGPWTVAKQVPADLAKAEKDAVASGQVDLLTGRIDAKKPGPSLVTVSPPVIYAVTFPTELIVTEGAPRFVPIEGTQLKYVENTTGHVFLHAGDQRIYVLISGRWFAADTLKGPWQYIPGGQLPEDFAHIPDTSPKENVKASVPGTPQALEAVIANAIPQTATVDRKQARMAPPKFDGEPQWKAIEGTTLRYAINTAWPVIQVEPDAYFAIENGVWFSARSLGGPWTVADAVPATIYSIPPSSPLHNLTYVKVYHSTSETVFVGYTAGYYGTCVSHGSGPVVVYGTGYHYTPWVGAVWYGSPLTYGYGSALTFTPWTGWTYGFGFGLSAPNAASNEDSSPATASVTTTAPPSSSSSSTSVSLTFVYGTYPWWGPYGWAYYYPYPYYYPPYYYPIYGAAWGPYGAAAWGPYGWAATTGNVYHRWGDRTGVTRTSGGYNAWTGNAWARQVGASYNSRTGTIAAGQRGYVGNVYTGNYAYGGRGAVYNPSTGQGVAGGRYTVGNAGSGESTSVGWLRNEQGGVARVGDDIYGARDGTVYRRTENGWESNSGGGWQTIEPPSGPPRAEPASGMQRDTRQQRPSAQPADRSQTGSLQPSRPVNQDTWNSLNRDYTARQAGQQRTQNYRSGSYRSAGRSRGGRRR